MNKRQLLFGLVILAAVGMVRGGLVSSPVTEVSMARAEIPITHPDGPTRYALFAAG